VLPIYAMMPRPAVQCNGPVTDRWPGARQVRPGVGGGVMVDVPRFSESLARRVDRVAGGLAAIWLSHRDDVADVKRWKVRRPLATTLPFSALVSCLSAACLPFPPV
jgi:hypothetical protein